MQAPQDTYCFDADALISLDNASLLNQLRKFAQTGHLKVPKRAYVEACRRASKKFANRLAQWEAKYGIVVDLDRDQAALRVFPDIETNYGPEFRIGGITYPGFWKSPSGRQSADAQVVALAKSRGWTVVSDDRSIRGACALENVACRGWEEIATMLMHGS